MIKIGFGKKHCLNTSTTYYSPWVDLPGIPFGRFCLYPVEAELLKTSQFKRLKNLSQLSFCDSISEDCIGNPGANYSRLLHSLQTAFWARAQFDGTTIEYEPMQITSEVSALLHDIGHTCFSHALESEATMNHEKKTVEIIKETEIIDILEKHDIDTKTVLKSVLKNDNFESQAVRGTLGADKIAYTIYDSFVSGVSSELLESEYIRPRILTQTAYNLNGKHCHRICEDTPQDLFFNYLTTFFKNRTELFQNVYGGPTNSKKVTMLKNLVQIALEENEIVDDDLFTTEFWLLHKLLNFEKTKEHTKKLIEEELLETALAIPGNEETGKILEEYRNDRDKRLDFEESIGGYIDINPLSKFPKAEFYILIDGKNLEINGTEIMGDYSGYIKSLASSFVYDFTCMEKFYNSQILNRVVVFAKPGNDLEAVAKSAISEMGLEEPENYVSLYAFSQEGF